jgi:hypothetical protein
MRLRAGSQSGTQRAALAAHGSHHTTRRVGHHASTRWSAGVTDVAACDGTSAQPLGASAAEAWPEQVRALTERS